MIIYIAGPISGIPDGNKEAFSKAEDKLKQANCIVLNPASLPEGLSEAAYMDICLAMIRAADGIYLLPGWHFSKGAIAEYYYARKLGLRIERCEDLRELLDCKPSSRSLG